MECSQIYSTQLNNHAKNQLFFKFFYIFPLCKTVAHWGVSFTSIFSGWFVILYLEFLLPKFRFPVQ